MRPQPRRFKSRKLVLWSLLVSAALAIAVLAARNLYDDEVSSLPLITSSLTHILAVNAQTDVNPPGMYLLAHLAYSVIPSFRWLNLFPMLVTYAGLGCFLLQVTPLFRSTRQRLCLLLLATLHPQLLMWSASFRWYGWWLGLALLTLTLALQPREPRPTLTSARALTLGILLAALFYLNYITFLFAIALALALLLRYRTLPWTRVLLSLLMMLAAFALLIAPGLHALIAVHIPHADSQRFGVLTSTARLLQSLLASEAYLPWNPAAIATCVVFFVLCIAGIFALLRPKAEPPRNHFLQPNPPASNNALASILTFALVFLVLVAATGLGGKPRNGLLLIPVLAPAAAWTIGAFGRRMQSAVLLFLALWCALGADHMLRRHGLAKATMIERPEQVVALVRDTPGCSVVITYDDGLAFALAQAELPRLVLFSPFEGPLYTAAQSLPEQDCTGTMFTTLYAVRSYTGAETGAWTTALNTELQSATQLVQDTPRLHYLSYDPDASNKRALARLPLVGRDLASAAQLPDYRFVVLSGTIDPASLITLRQRLPDYHTGTAPQN